MFGNEPGEVIHSRGAVLFHHAFLSHALVPCEDRSVISLPPAGSLVANCSLSNCERRETRRFIFLGRGLRLIEDDFFITVANRTDMILVFVVIHPNRTF